MQWEHVQANWARLWPQARERWTQLDEATLVHSQGSRAMLTEALIRQYGIARAASEDALDEWVQHLDDPPPSEGHTGTQQTSPTRVLPSQGDI